MTRRHQQHETWALAPVHGGREFLEPGADVVVDPAGLVPGVERLDELDQPTALQLTAGQFDGGRVKREVGLNDFEYGSDLGLTCLLLLRRRRLLHALLVGRLLRRP